MKPFRMGKIPCLGANDRARNDKTPFFIPKYKGNKGNKGNKGKVSLVGVRGKEHAGKIKTSGTQNKKK